MRVPIDCQGAPRDLGLDQGRGCAAELGGRYDARSLAERLRTRIARPDRRTAGTARDVARYFPRHAETLDGLALGARVPRAWLVAQLADAGFRDASGFGLPAAGLSGAFVADGACVARALPESFFVRRAAPEGGFRALEVAPSWFGGALAGVSEAGLAAAVVEVPGGDAETKCLAPAALLAQDCLHRFESLDGALDWCLGRPAGGAAELVLADAAGDVACVSLAPSGRRVHRPADGLARAGLGEQAAKAIREAAPLRAEQLPQVLGMPLVVLDPGARRIGLGAEGAATDWLPL